MMNKKVKVFIIAVLILQILMPAGLLYHHYTLHDRAMKESPDFKFRLKYLDIWDTANKGEILSWDLAGIYNFYGDDIAVTVDANGFADMTIVENKTLNKHWFSYDYYVKIGSYYGDKGEFIYEENENAKKIMSEWKNKYYKAGGEMLLDYSGGNTVYLTAKVYKGVFIPIAVYKDDVKVITFSKNK